MLVPREVVRSDVLVDVEQAVGRLVALGSLVHPLEEVKLIGIHRHDRLLEFLQPHIVEQQIK